MAVINAVLKNNKNNYRIFNDFYNKGRSGKIIFHKMRKNIIKNMFMKLNNHFVELRYT
jgi:hypothetical protein